MALHHAFRNSARNIADVQSAYKQSVIFVNNEATGVYSSQLGVLNTLPPDWQDFVNAHQIGDPFGSKTTVFLSAFRFPFY